MKRFIVLLLTAAIASVLCGCGASEYSKDNEYVQKIKSLVNTSVEYTRVWRENDQSFDYSDTESANEYINILDKLCQTYRKILILQPTNKFDENDLEMKESIRNIIAVTSEIKSHVKYSVDKADDSLFKKEKQELFDRYDEYHEAVASSSQYIQTFWRNA